MKNDLQKLLKQSQKSNLPAQVLSQAFPAQRDFILDPSKRKAAFVLRRGGKTTTFAIYLLYTALANPKTKSLFMGLSKDSAENAMWLNIMEPILLKLDIKHKFNRSQRLITLENQSTIKLTGTDADDSQINKYLGGKYILAIFDEAQSIKHDLKHWIEDQLGPAMIDYGGNICIGGTAGRAIGRYWYDITQPESEINSWSIHRWQAESNPMMKQKLDDEMARLRKENPGIELTEGYRNQYLCEWVLDNQTRVYHNQESNILQDEEIILSLTGVNPKWKYMIGFDFGFEDDTAFTVAAFNKYDNHMYIVETFKKPGMLTEETAEKLQQLRDKYRPIYIVGDCQNKTLVETLRKQYRLPLRSADKLGKEAHIASMNSDFTTNKIKIIKALNEPLLKEWATLIWNEKKRIIGKFEELASKDNHCADSCLYVHHFSQHFRAVDEPIPDPNPMRTQAETTLKRQLMAYDQDDKPTIYDYMDNL